MPETTRFRRSVNVWEIAIFVVQGANDPRIPQSEAEQLVSSLDERDIPHEYLFFEDEGHDMVKIENKAEYLDQTVSLFRSEFQNLLRCSDVHDARDGMVVAFAPLAAVVVAYVQLGYHADVAASEHYE